MRRELVGVSKHGATAGALKSACHSAHAVGPFKNDLVKFPAAADRASEREVQADHFCLAVAPPLKQPAAGSLRVIRSG